MTAVPWLERDPSALIKLKNSKQPREISTRVRDRSIAWNPLEDTTQSGFGTGLFTKGRLIFE